MQPGAKEFREFRKRFELMLNKFYDFNSELKSFLESIEIFQKNLKAWIESNADIAKKLNASDKQHARRVKELANIGDDLSLAMQTFSNNANPFLNAHIVFKKEMVGMLENQSIDEIMDDLPRIITFCDRYDISTDAKMAELKKEMKTVKSLKDKTEAIYKKTIN